MDLVGERWSLLIMRELLLGARRFGEIRAALVGLSANVLTQRLDGLEQAGIVRKRTLPSPANVQVYELTRWGYAAEDAIFALSRWAAGSPAHDVTLPLSNAAFMLSLKTMMDAGKARALDPDLGFRVGGEPFRARIVDGGLVIARADPAGAGVVFTGEPTPLAATFYGPQSLSEAEAAGLVAVTGDRAVAQAFVDCFRLPRFVNG
ncbi:winged helix-turn-helix transcriptional regulator [Hephaestia sp. GCM10023244]|uniref:winged helix-turn-helix transcriptional regulator n=1 Tax=unclassified Hephaestia TaxID=2631281 RepID=UPI0020771B08|nr:winged helix-turn-helix transcriptional regulator [Hephaestia sp. MAHUQ-44]MCM8729917.1 winged helix-turn-helix transcriptional regulator [Hephaestia sp. MAHUQ-44]